MAEVLAVLEDVDEVKCRVSGGLGRTCDASTDNGVWIRSRWRAIEVSYALG